MVTKKTKKIIKKKEIKKNYKFYLGWLLLFLSGLIFMKIVLPLLLSVANGILVLIQMIPYLDINFLMILLIFFIIVIFKLSVGFLHIGLEIFNKGLELIKK